MAVKYECDRCKNQYNGNKELKRITLPRVLTRGETTFNYNSDGYLLFTEKDLCAKCMAKVHEVLEAE